MVALHVFYSNIALCPPIRVEATPEAAMAARLAAPSTVYGGGAKSGKNTPKPTMSKQEKNSLKRGGAGRHAFKSKTRHKRRH